MKETTSNSVLASTCLPPNIIVPSIACTPLSPRIKLIEYNWLAASMNVHVAKIILEEILGVCVDVEEYGVEQSLQIMESGGNDIPYVLLEFWKMSRLESYRKYVLNGENIIDIGDLGPIGQVGWYIPHWMATNNPFTLNYRYYRLVENFRFISGSKTWVNYDEQIIQNLKLNLDLEYPPPENSTEHFLVQELKKAEEEHTELVSYFYTPHQLFSRPNPPQRVSLPPFTSECASYHNVKKNLVDCDYAMSTFSKLQTKAVETFHPKVQNMFRRIKFTNADQISMMGYVAYDSMSKEDAACRWLLSGNNTERWKTWISEISLPTERKNGFIISIAVLSFTAIITIFGLLILCCVICIRKNSIRKRENRLAPKTAPICIIFTHIQNASLLWTLDSDLMKKVINIHHKIVRENIRKFKGYEVKTQSDGFMIAFQDPIDAVGCCFAIQNGLLKGNWSEEMLEFPDMKEVKWNNHLIYRGPRVKMGLKYGHDIEAHFDPTTKRYDYFGTTVNQASRTENQSQGGRIYICSDIQHLLKQQASKFHNCIVDRLSIHSKDPVFQFKQLLYTGKIQFENMGNFVLKGLSGNHTIYWVMDITSPRTSYSQQFDFLPHIRETGDSLTIPLVINKIDKDRMELKQECALCISDPTIMTIEEKSILLHRLVLWNNIVVESAEEDYSNHQPILENLIPTIISQFIHNVDDGYHQSSHNLIESSSNNRISTNNTRRHNSLLYSIPPHWNGSPSSSTCSSSASNAVISCPEEVIRSSSAGVGARATISLTTSFNQYYMNHFMSNNNNNNQQQCNNNEENITIIFPNNNDNNNNNPFPSIQRIVHHSLSQQQQKSLTLSPSLSPSSSSPLFISTHAIEQQYEEEPNLILERNHHHDDDEKNEKFTGSLFGIVNQ